MEFGAVLIEIAISLLLSGCADGEQRAGLCVNPEIRGDSATLEGTQSLATGPGTGNATGPGPGPEDGTPDGCTESGQKVFCEAPPKCVPTGARDCFGVTTLLTLHDVAAFHPTAAAHAMQPNGWAVIGLPTNFTSSGGAQVVTGTLLGAPAQVRFTPNGWRWDYGDGTSRSASTPGRPWGPNAEFEATPTSHIFTQRGTYTIRLTVDYRVEYSLAGAPWLPIDGILSLPARPLTVTVGGATTVLVDDDCRANPAGPGC